MADEELKKAFQDLHAKRIDTAKKINQNQNQISQLQRTVKMAALTEEEINGCSEGTRMYKSVGRMFLLQSKDDLIRQLRIEKEESQKSIESMNKKIETLKGSLQESEEKIREMVSDWRCV